MTRATALPLAAGALTGLPDSTARKALAALEEASLLERRPGGRYAMHDMVRAYPATRSRAHRVLCHAYEVADTLDSLGALHAALGDHEQARAA